MGQGFSVNARKLAAGSQDVTGLLGRCEAIAADAVQAIVAMGGTAGHAGLAGGGGRTGHEGVLGPGQRLPARGQRADHHGQHVHTGGAGSGEQVRGHCARAAVSGAIVMPGGDPAVLEQMAARLETAAQGAGRLADSTSQVTADVRLAAEWTGDAADGYTAFTKNLATGVNGTGAPLAQIAAAVREYAGSLRAAQQKVTAYAAAARNAQAAGTSPASLASAELAGQDAATAVAAQQAAGDRAAATVRAASKELADPFGPDGAVRSWIEQVETPWDLSAGDAILGRYLAGAASGREDMELAEEFAKGPAGADVGKVQRVRRAVDVRAEQRRGDRSRAG